MAEIYFTITGTGYRHGQEFIKPEMKVTLVKEPDNEFDKEAIKIEMPGIGHIGYVANSPYTVIGESYSAGRLYDKIEDMAIGTVFKAEQMLISLLNQHCGKLATSMPEHCSAGFQRGIMTPTEIRKRNPPPIEAADICMLVICAS